MKKSRFKTKLTKKQRCKNMLVFFAVSACLYAFTLLFGYGIDLFDGCSIGEACLLGFAMTFFISSMVLVPTLIAAIALGIQKGRARRVRDDASFVPVQDIDYYRDNLGKLAPAYVSLLIDLNLYGKKDIVATLLSMQNKKAIRIEKDGRIVQVAKKPQKLDDSERELLSLIKNGKLNNKRDLQQWKQNCFTRAHCLGYIQRKDQEDKNKIIAKCLLIAVFSTILAIVIWGAFLHFEMFMADSVFGWIMALAMILSWDFFLFVPWYVLMQWVSYSYRFDILWERTPLGNEIAEKIAGLARFIHEFSLLSEAKQEQVALWEDYLIYAIVLEENEQIVDEISKQYKIHLPNL